MRLFGFGKLTLLGALLISALVVLPAGAAGRAAWGSDGSVPGAACLRRSGRSSLTPAPPPARINDLPTSPARPHFPERRREPDRPP